jgi:hypothetical protein
LFAHFKFLIRHAWFQLFNKFDKRWREENVKMQKKITINKK